MQINIQKRHLVIIVSALVLLGVISYAIAVAGVSHTGAEIESLPWTKITGKPAGLNDGDQNTNAQTICGSSRYLRGDGSCRSPAAWHRQYRGCCQVGHQGW